MVSKHLRKFTICALCSLSVVGLFYFSQLGSRNKIPLSGLSVERTPETTLNRGPVGQTSKSSPLKIGVEQKNLIATNKQTVERVRQICQKYKKEVVGTYMDYKQKLTITLWLWMLFPRHDLFYCALPKCASTTWKSYLMEDSGVDWKGLDTHVASKEFGAFKILEKELIEPIELLRKLTYKNRLVIVRNPWGRLISAYEDKVQRQNWPLKRLCLGWKKYLHVSQDKITFPMFIDCVLDRPQGIHRESHTHPMADLCGVCHADYNIIIRLEELKQNEWFLMSHLKFKRIPEYIPPKVVNKTNNYQEYYSQLNKNTIKKIYETYKWDLEMFGYPKSPFDD